MSAHAVGGQLQEFRNGFQVLVGVCDIDVPEIGSELWHLPSDVNAGSIPLDEFARCKTVAEVLKSRPTVDPAVSRSGAQTDSARNSGEGAAGSTPLHPSARRVSCAMTEATVCHFYR